MALQHQDRDGRPQPSAELPEECGGSCRDEGCVHVGQAIHDEHRRLKLDQHRRHLRLHLAVATEALQLARKSTLDSDPTVVDSIAIASTQPRLGSHQVQYLAVHDATNV